MFSDNIQLTQFGLPRYLIESWTIRCEPYLTSLVKVVVERPEVDILENQEKISRK